MISPVSITKSNYNCPQTLPLSIRISSAVDDDTEVQAPGDVVQNIPLMASDCGDCNGLTADGCHASTVPPLEGIEGVVMEAQSSTTGDAREGSWPSRIRIHPKLYKAAVKGNVKLLKEFLQSPDFEQLDGPSQLQGVTIGDNTVLHIAATSSCDLRWQHKGDYVDFAKEVYNIWLKNQKEVYNIRNRSLLMARNRLKETPLHCAAKAGNYTMVSLLISFAEQDNQDGVETLLTARNMHGETALHEAVRVGHCDIVNKLILSEPSLTGIVDAEGVSPLYQATMMNALNIVEIFTREEPSMVSCAGPKGQTALHAAVLEHEDGFDQKNEILQSKLEPIGEELSGITGTLLKWNNELAKEVDDSGSTPLHYAASVGNLATIKLLLQNETSAAYIADKDGLCPIHIAAKCGRAFIIKEMIKRCPDLDELLDKEGRNFLHLSILSGKGNILPTFRYNHTFLRMLNARDYQGNTPLHLASGSGQYHIVRFLISMKKVCSSIMNRDGLTPVDLAIKEVDQGYRFTLGREYLILRCLMMTGALPSSHRFDHYKDVLKLPCKDKMREIEKLESVIRNLGIISVLIATVTFAASFTMPGGYIADDHVNRGTPILSQKYAFKAFIVADLLAFLLSILATSWLIYAGSANVSIQLRFTFLALSVTMVMIAAKATVCAFALAIYTMLYQVNLRISELVLVASFGLLLFHNPVYWGMLRLAAPIVSRVGLKGLFIPHFRPQTWRRVQGVYGLGLNFSAVVFGRMFGNIFLYGIIFLLALL